MSSSRSSRRSDFIAEQPTVFNLSGEETLRLLASVGITAVARLTTDWLAVGYANGNVELLRSQETSATTASATPNQSLERTPASGVTRIIPGPMGTLIAGYGNGFVGMWSMRDGKLLADGHIHGPIEHLLLEDHGLYAASSLGQHLVWDLSTFYVERCTLLREVWQRVPVVWQEGRAVAATPPSWAWRASGDRPASRRTISATGPKTGIAPWTTPPTEVGPACC